MKIKESLPGISISRYSISLIAWYLGKLFPIIGGPVIGLFIGLLLASLPINQKKFLVGMQFTSKKVLQYAVVLLGFGLNLSQVFNVGLTSLPIILATITTALITAYFIHKLFKLDSEIATLVGVGSSTAVVLLLQPLHLLSRPKMSPLQLQSLLFSFSTFWQLYFFPT